MGGGESGIAQMNEGLSKLEDTGTVLGLRGFLVQLAEGYMQVGRNHMAFAALDKSESQEAAKGTHCWDAEIGRVRGELLAAGSGAEQRNAESAFRSALDTARRQGARSLELRVAVSYARLLRAQGRQTEARELLNEILGSLTEGRDTVDVREARATANA